MKSKMPTSDELQCTSTSGGDLESLERTHTFAKTTDLHCKDVEQFFNRGDSISEVAGRKLRRLGTSVAHYASLMLVENPIAQHKEYLGQLDSFNAQNFECIKFQDEDHSVRVSLMARERWQYAIGSIIESSKLLKNICQMMDTFSDGCDKFAAVVEVECMLQGNVNKKQLIQAVVRQHSSRMDGFMDLVTTEILLIGERIFNFFTPGALGHHVVLLTFVIFFFCFMIFFYMAGYYPLYVSYTTKAIPKCLVYHDSVVGWKLVWKWIFHKNNSSCLGQTGWVFDSIYLQQWGARYGPLMGHEPSRWFTSWFVHHSFEHVATNMALFLLVTYQVEEKYGFWRVLLLFFISGIGGGFFSAAFEGGCNTVQGISGSVFGMIGLFVADIIINFETVRRPILRCIVVLAFLVYLIVGSVKSPGTISAWSHVGGFLCGLFPSFLFLPNLKSERWEQIFPIAGGLVTTVLFITLPVYYYKHVLPALNC